VPRPTARLLSAAVTAVLLATTGPVVAAPSSPASRAAAPAASARSHPHYLRVATWNISGILTDGKGHSVHARWRDRRATVARQLLAQAPVGQRGKPADVIALQEANADKKLPSGRTQYTDLVHRLNHNATGATRYKKITTKLRSRATRIVYNAHTVTLLKRGALTWKAQESKADGPRMMAWAIFRHRTTGKKFFFASVHLETASKKIRKKQWKQLIHVVPRLAHGHPVLIGGDFNATRNQKGNAAAKFLPRMRRAGFGDTLGQNSADTLKVSRARPHRVTRGNLNSVNFYQRKLGHAWSRRYVGQDVDYLFASNRLSVRGWSMVVNVPHGSNRLRGMVPSDHNLIRAKIVIKR
jgi:endonuclease/exonuclease/phosphatase family metal-dependent hydrolase